MISTPVCESRFPVGSSARMMEGLIHQRARNRDTLALAAGEFVWLVVHAIGEFDQLEATFWRVRCAPWKERRCKSSGSSTLCSAVARGKQIECLEDEADFLVPDAGELVIVHLADEFPVQASTDLSSAYRDSRSNSSSVDLPEPDGPMMATYSFRRIAK